MKWAPSLLGLLTVTACTTVGPDIAFDAHKPQSFALIAADGLRGATYMWEFQKVDRSALTFRDEYFYVSFDPLVGSEFRKPQGLETTVRFGGAEVPPGEYALVSQIEHSGGVGFNCFSKGAPLYHFHAGKVQIVPIGASRSGAQVTDTELERLAGALLKAYPKMSAEYSIAPSSGSVTYEVAPSRMGQRPCLPAGPFKLSAP